MCYIADSRQKFIYRNSGLPKNYRKNRKGSPTGNPVVDAWSEQQHLKVHLESEVTRFDDFMQKNPDFLELFTQKYYDKFSQQYHRPNINDID